MTSKKIASISLLAIFVLGFVLGIAVDRYFFDDHSCRHSHHKHNKPDLIQKFTRELDLTSEQQQKLSELLQGIKKRHNEIRKSSNEQYKLLRENFRKSFLEILNEKQKAKFLEMNNCSDKKRSK